jgi:hypothetical protein
MIAREAGVPSAEELLEHLEASLGPLTESESVAQAELKARGLPPISLLSFGRSTRQPVRWATFGLSRHLLDAKGRTITQELVIHVADREFAIGALTAIADHALGKHLALLPGERHRLHGWSERSPISGVLVVPDPELPPFADADPRVEFARLLPITDSEAAFARVHGWQVLTARLAAAGVDVSDLHRPSFA